jgi:hypothetical protein
MNIELSFFLDLVRNLNVRFWSKQKCPMLVNIYLSQEAKLGEILMPTTFIRRQKMCRRVSEGKTLKREITVH